MENCLLEISSSILKAKNENGSGVDLIRMFLDRRERDRDSDTCHIAEAVVARMISHSKDKRVKLSRKISKNCA